MITMCQNITKKGCLLYILVLNWILLMILSTFYLLFHHITISPLRETRYNSKWSTMLITQYNQSDFETLPTMSLNMKLNILRVIHYNCLKIIKESNLKDQSKDCLPWVLAISCILIELWNKVLCLGAYLSFPFKFSSNYQICRLKWFHYHVKLLCDRMELYFARCLEKNIIVIYFP